ncbi:MAG TPA: PilX N-terminal domain-containing pilus assembly protein [Gammaproteobacteria bacterium]|jgi:MSHA biogenesis protein MshP
MRRKCSYSRQHGISIVLVLFLLTVVTVMVVSMANLSTGQHIGSLYAARGAQAYFAARAGVDYAISRIENGAAGCGDVAASLTIAGHDVDITCTLTSTPSCTPPPLTACNEGGPTAYSVYAVSAVASRGNFQVPDVATRVVRATIKNP